MVLAFQNLQAHFVSHTSDGISFIDLSEPSLTLLTVEKVADLGSEEMLAT